MKEAEIIKAEDYLDMLKDKAKETDELAKENLQLREEIERLNKENELLKSSPNFVYAMRNHKAIEYLEKADDNENSYGDYETHYEVKKELLDILKGVDKECKS